MSEVKLGWGNRSIMNLLRLAAIAVFTSGLSSAPAMAQFADDNLDALVDAREIPVTIDNFIRAATDIEFGK
jgi:hypothetical protein